MTPRWQISCSCNVPFAVFDEATSFFRGALSEALGEHMRNNVFYASNECFRCARASSAAARRCISTSASAMACPPPPAPPPFPQCSLAYNSTPPFDGYWPTIPPALDFVSIDACASRPLAASKAKLRWLTPSSQIRR